MGPAYYGCCRWAVCTQVMVVVYAGQQPSLQILPLPLGCRHDSHHKPSHALCLALPAPNVSSPSATPPLLKATGSCG